MIHSHTALRLALSLLAASLAGCCLGGGGLGGLAQPGLNVARVCMDTDAVGEGGTLHCTVSGTAFRSGAGHLVVSYQTMDAAVMQGGFLLILELNQGGMWTEFDHETVPGVTLGPGNVGSVSNRYDLTAAGWQSPGTWRVRFLTPTGIPLGEQQFTMN